MWSQTVRPGGSVRVGATRPHDRKDLQTNMNCSDIGALYTGGEPSSTDVCNSRRRSTTRRERIDGAIHRPEDVKKPRILQQERAEPSSLGRKQNACRCSATHVLEKIIHRCDVVCATRAPERGARGHRNRGPRAGYCGSAVEAPGTQAAGNSPEAGFLPENSARKPRTMLRTRTRPPGKGVLQNATLRT